MVKQLLKKYDLMLPVLPGEQRRIYRAKRRTFAAIIGSEKKSSFITDIIVRFYYIMRNAGMPVSLTTAGRMAAFASITAVLIVSAGSVMVLQNIIYRQGVIAVKDIHKTGTIAAADRLTIRRGESEISSPKVLDQIAVSDEISTGEKSTLLQFDNGALVKIQKNSSVLVVSLGSHYVFNIKTGGIITRIPAIAEGSSYSIHTPDSIITVKGTEFGVIYDKERTDVFVKQGIVAVNHVPSGSVYDVNGGNSSIVNSEKKVSALTEAESSILKGFSELRYVESIGTKSETELREIKEKLDDSDKLKADEDPVKKMTLAEMKEKYGKLDEIVLFNGKKYTGVIISRGESYKILTSAGVITFKRNELKETRIIQ